MICPAVDALSCHFQTLVLGLGLDLLDARQRAGCLFLEGLLHAHPSLGLSKATVAGEVFFLAAAFPFGLALPLGGILLDLLFPWGMFLALARLWPLAWLRAFCFHPEL